MSVLQGFKTLTKQQKENASVYASVYAIYTLNI